jgi:hypothetical protein
MRTARLLLWLPAAALAATLSLLPATRTDAGADVVVFADALAGGWSNWSWGTQASFASATQVHAGAAAIAVTYTQAWAGLYLHVEPALDGSQYETLRFWIRSTGAGAQLRVALAVAGGDFGPPHDVTAAADVWTEVAVPVAALGSPATITGIVWQDTTGGAQPTFHLDEVALVAWSVPPTPTPVPTPAPGPALAIDAAADVHPISPDIYGMNYAEAALAEAVRLPVRRWGGNSTSRFNWQIDTSNTGSDWYFENIAQPAGAADAFVAQDRGTGTRTIMTVPLIGRVAKRRLESHPFDCGFRVARYGAQQSTDPWDPDCGNGVRTDGSGITGNDPTDTSTAADPAFVAEWVSHLVATFGPAAAGGVAYYNLDNEPMLWPGTHRDVHPQPTGYDEMRDRTYAYATAVKAADPTARTLGPVVWGWTAYFWSALDWAGGGDWWSHPPDRLAHGDVPFVEWYLQQMRAYEKQHGVRILDYCDVHFYPPDVALAGAGSAALQARRLRSTRLLWDRAYSEESWIAAPVYLVPRLREWVAADYPGTRTAITEYNWGALDSLNGALAQADVLGIFGRERLDLATLWGPPEIDDPGAFAFRMYRNADGAGHGFGETGVRAASSDQGRLAVYAALRATGELTAIVVNKTSGALEATVALTGFAPDGPVQVFRYSGANLGAIEREPDLAATPAGLTATFPASSITLLVVPGGGSPPPAHPVRRRIAHRRP